MTEAQVITGPGHKPWTLTLFIDYKRLIGHGFICFSTSQYVYRVEVDVHLEQEPAR